MPFEYWVKSQAPTAPEARRLTMAPAGKSVARPPALFGGVPTPEPALTPGRAPGATMHDVTPLPATGRW